MEENESRWARRWLREAKAARIKAFNTSKCVKCCWMRAIKLWSGGGKKRKKKNNKALQDCVEEKPRELLNLSWFSFALWSFLSCFSSCLPHSLVVCLQLLSWCQTQCSLFWSSRKGCLSLYNCVCVCVYPKCSAHQAFMQTCVSWLF